MRSVIPSAARSLLLLLFAVACTFDRTTISREAPQIVVHAVLDPSAVVQEVLVERTLTGGVTIRDGVRYDPLDPINSGGGDPVVGADVSITGPDGTWKGSEVKYPGKPVAYGAGRYEVIAGAGTRPIRAGAEYTLSVRTTTGNVVTGHTLTPLAPAFTNLSPLVTFDRDRDTLDMKWNAAKYARTYGLRVESPFGAFLLFSDSTHLRFAGDLRNLFASDLQKVFIPGFRQVVTVFAVDTNFFDYYRSRNDPFTGSGIINKLDGGIGLFGAIAIVSSRTLDVTQQPKEPAIEGDYEASPANIGPKQVDIMRLYVETPGALTSLSGWYTVNRVTAPRDGIAGARDGVRIELQFLLDQDSRRRLVTWVGAQEGDSLVGAYTNASARVVFRRRKT
ncbi:MAG: hypothetical protein ABIY52_16545 [Gemmatimonadaceae bacterium]